MEGARLAMRRCLFGLAAQQGGYFTAGQARQVGYSYQAQAHHVGAGNWVRVDRGLFQLADWVSGADDELARWSLWSRGLAVVSHESALTVHGIGELEAMRVHLTVPPGFTGRHANVILHRADLPPDDVQERMGYRVTTPLRTVIDVARDADGDQLVRLISEARARGLLTVRSLRSRSEAVDVHAALAIERALSSMPPK